MGLATIKGQSWSFRGVALSNYFDMILPGRATLTVQSRPLLGWNIAVGFEVSTTAGLFAVTSGVPFDIGLTSDLRFRFCD